MSLTIRSGLLVSCSTMTTGYLEPFEPRSLWPNNLWPGGSDAPTTNSLSCLHSPPPYEHFTAKSTWHRKTTRTTNMVAHQQHSNGSINRSVVPRNFNVPTHIVQDPDVDQVQNNDRDPSECDRSYPTTTTTTTCLHNEGYCSSVGVPGGGGGNPGVAPRGPPKPGPWCLFLNTGGPTQGAPQDHYE